MNDYSAQWPLWAEDGMIGPDDLGLSPPLAADLKAWQELFDADFHWETGWRTPAAQERHAREAAALVRRLRAEVGPDVEVELDTWPVSDTRLKKWLERRMQAN